jgi:uncharacterized membrane protein
MINMDHLQNELKKEFQLERLILFSDAVFAIAITLLVIELKIPEIPGQLVTETKLLESLANLIPKFVGFLVSFFIIGLFWTVHHRMFAYVVDYNRNLLWLNLMFLLFVVLMPFSTGFYSEYISYLLITPIVVYVSNICLIGIMNTFLWHYISNPKNNLVEGLHPLVTRYFMIRSIVTPLVFLLMGLVYIFIDPRIALWIPPLVPFILRAVTARSRRQLKKLQIRF